MVTVSDDDGGCDEDGDSGVVVVDFSWLSLLLLFIG